MPSDPVRLLPIVGLLALVPVAVFTLDRGDPAVWLSAACVLLIVGSLRRAFAPADATPGA